MYIREEVWTPDYLENPLTQPVAHLLADNGGGHFDRGG